MGGEENALRDIEKALLKGHFCSFAEKGKGIYPQDHPSWVPASCSSMLFLAPWGRGDMHSFLIFYFKQDCLDLHN